MKLALVIPTRGVLFARTVQSTILNPEFPKDSHVIIVSGLPIPDSHNTCIRKALATDCTHIWFVEEDMEIPEHGLETMMAYANEGAPYVAIDYPITIKWRTTVWTEQKQTLWTGFGCTLIARSVFEGELKDPWLTDKYEVLIEQMHPLKYRVRERKPDPKNYGMFDIWFGLQLQKMGIPIKVLEGKMCNHLRMRSWERKEANQGTHEIYEL
jgi:hypothetical protein